MAHSLETPMTLARNALAFLAVAGLVAAPAAAHGAVHRAPTPMAASERFVGDWVIVALLIGALVPLALLLASDSDNESAPASP